MINYYYATLKIETITKLKSFRTGCWVDVEQPQSADLKHLGSFGLDPNLVDDALDPYEVPRYEYSNGTAYFFARSPVSNASLDDLPTYPLLIALDEQAVYTIAQKDASRLWDPLLSDTSVATTQRTKLFILLVQQLVNDYRQEVSLINKQVRVVTKGVHSVTKSNISDLIECERKLNDYLDSLSPMNEALESMLDGKNIKLYEDDREILEDLSLSFEQLILRCSSAIKGITNIRDSYSMILDSKLNDTIKLLTVITVCLTIPTMVAGIYGMNIQLPGNIHHPAYFWGLIMGSLLFSAAFGFYFYKKR